MIDRETYETTKITISGYVVGPIWWPAGAECYVGPVTFDGTDYEARCVDSSRPGEPVHLTLREHVLAMLREHGGDFQHCELADGMLTIERRRSGAFRHVRTFELSMFPSIADLRNDDWAGPSFDEDV